MGRLSLRKACRHSEKASFLLPPRREAVHYTAIPALHQKNHARKAAGMAECRKTPTVQ
jgi:hypothetical protein